jgi:membrane-associated phospholipid phosphatase
VDTAVVIWLNQQAQHSGARGLAVAGAKYLVVAPVLVALALAARSIWRRDAEATASVIVAGLGTAIAFAANVVATSAWFRARPYAALSEVHALVAPTAESSFFSDHTIAISGAAFGALLVSRRWGAVAVATAVVVGVARVAVGAHYPTDVLTAAVVTTLAIAALLPARAFVAKRISPLIDRVPSSWLTPPASRRTPPATAPGELIS